MTPATGSESWRSVAGDATGAGFVGAVVRIAKEVIDGEH
jgi:hypothetical protein